MKKNSLLLLLFFMAVGLRATISIDETRKYTFVCTQWGTGNMVLGANHGSTYSVFYDITSDNAPGDHLWVLRKDGEGYTIRNASSGEYLVYVAGTQTNSAGEVVSKGIGLAATAAGDEARWLFAENGQGTVTIENVGTRGQYFNVRIQNNQTPYLVGTYGDNSSANSFFDICDENGRSIIENNGTDPSDSAIKGESGQDENGAYWERTGLKQPVVFTTDTKNPVLYYIRNVRSGYYATDGGTKLTQSEKASGQFYFVQSGKGIQIYSSAGNYVATSFPYSYQGQSGLNMESGTSVSNNIWGFGFTNKVEMPGYTIEKLDNLPGSGWTSQSSYLYWNDYDLGTNRVVGLYDVDAGSTFVFSSADSRHLAYLMQQGVVIEGVEPEGFRAFVDSIRLGGKDLVHDYASDSYFAPLPASARDGADYVARFEVKMRQTDTEYSLTVDGKPLAADGTVTLNGVTCETPYTIAVMKNGTEEVASAQLNFTFLPIVEIKMPSCNGSYYTTGSIRVTDANFAGYDSTYIAAFRYRGATAQSFAKKSYAVKLRDADGNSVDHEYFGLRNDNNWILDAMAVDKACMRNRVSTDLWNDFAPRPYQRRKGWEPKAKSGTRGRFVEVFLNGEYHGLYCMTEKIDRKQLRLKKSDPATATSEETVRGTLYKSKQWGYEVFMGHEQDTKVFPHRAPAAYNNNLRAETWRSYEIKHPDWEDEKIDWGPLWNAINFVATSSDSEFDNSVEQYFELDELRDYYLFIELMLATDNHGKNMFFYNYDQLNTEYAKKMGIAPWDLDGTWGRRWDGSEKYTGAEQNFDTFLWEYEHGQHTIYYRLQNSQYWYWNDMLKERYAQLRQSDFNTEALKNRFQEYSDLFTESGAAGREQTRWGGYHRNIAGDVEFIKDWIEKRINFLDEQYDYTPISDGIKQTISTEKVYAAGGNGTIYVKATAPAEIKVHTLGGILVRSVRVGTAPVTLDGFAAGMYIVNGRKVLVK